MEPSRTDSTSCCCINLECLKSAYDCITEKISHLYQTIVTALTAFVLNKNIPWGKIAIGIGCLTVLLAVCIITFPLFLPATTVAAVATTVVKIAFWTTAPVTGLATCAFILNRCDSRHANRLSALS